MAYSQNLKEMSTKPDEYYSQSRPEMFKYIPQNAKNILDVGCGEGAFGQQLKKDIKAEVWGIELDNNAGAIAQTKLDKVYFGDVNQLLDTLPDKYFDCIVFNDILEHLVDPYSILDKIKSKLNQGGVIVCSLPNVRYFLTLKDLLVHKQWKYEDAGILDKTHLRFFTFKSIVEMFDSLDYIIEIIEGINSIKSWKFKLLNFLALGYLTDTKYLQFACVAKPKSV
jgi:2-polyprenyl-3-methyl-5-hydroxy-6-metoxy-1,4-benzoquinol methylase